MSNKVNPLIAPIDQSTDPFDNLDPKSISFPVKSNPLVDTLDETMDVDPNKAAEVLRLSDFHGQDPQYVEENFDSAKKAAALPTEDVLNKVRDKYPFASDFLSSPKNMAVAKDDIDSLTKTERTVKDYGFSYSMINSLNSGLYKTASSITRIPEYLYGAFALPQNLFSKSIGKPEWQVSAQDNPVSKYLDKAAERYVVPDLQKDVLQELQDGNISNAGRALAAQFVANAPNQAALLLGSIAGYGEAALVGAGLMQASGTYSDSLKAGADPSMAALNATYQGTVESAFENIGTFGILNKWENSIANSFGKDTSRKVMKDFAKSLAHSFAGEGNEEFWTQVAQDFSDYATGVNPNAMKGSLHRATNAFFLGGVSGGFMTAPTAFSMGILRGSEIRSSELAKKTYLAMGESAEASKLRQRLPSSHKEFVENVTKGSPVENIYVPVDSFNSYFQSKKIDPSTFAESLGISSQLEDAKQIGGDLKIPLSVWANEVVGTEHYQGLADDIKFTPDGLTVRQVNEIEKKASEDLNSEISKVQEQIKSDAETKNAYDTIVSDVLDKASGLAKPDGITEKQWPLVKESWAKLWAARSIAESNKRGISPLEYFKGVGLSIQNNDQSTTSVVGEVLNQDKASKVAQFIGYQETGDPEFPPFPLFNIPQGLENAGSTVDLEELQKRGIEAPAIPNFENWKSTDKSQELFQSAYHGSPYRFDKFSLHKVGSGEGSQAYGWGLYFSEEKGVAEYYKKKIAQSKNVKSDGTIYKVDIPDIEKFIDYQKLLVDQPTLQGISKKLKLGLDQYSSTGESFYEGVVQEFTREYKNLKPELKDFITKNKIDFDISKASELASRYLASKGVAGIRYLDQQSRSVGSGTSNYVVFDDQLVKIVEYEQSKGGDSVRGKVTISPEQAVISLFKEADASTFVHESAHIFLEDTFKYVQSGNAGQKYLEDWGTLSKWLDISAGQKSLTTEQQEKFARGFEAFMLEGNAPSDALRKVFTRFKRWLVGIYKGTAGLNVELSDPVRSVMSRMLASEEEIAAAERAMGLDIKIDVSGLDPKVVEKLSDLRLKAHEEAVSNLLKQRMQEIKATVKGTFAEERTRVTKELSAKLKETDDYKLLARIKKAMKLDPHDIASRYATKELQPGEIISLETQAQLEGLSSASELAQKISSIPPFDQVLKKQVDDHMRSLSDLRDPEKIRLQAAEIVHSENQVELMAYEKEALERMIYESTVKSRVSQARRIAASEEARIIKQQAKEILANKPLVESTSYSQYFTAERNAAVKVARALQKEDIRLAADLKRQQMLNHALATEALRNKNEVEKITKYLAGFSERGADMKDMPYGFIRQIDNLLIRFGLSGRQVEDQQMMSRIASDLVAKGADRERIANETGIVQSESGEARFETLPELVDRINDNYYAVDLSYDILRSDPKTMDLLKLKELKEIRDVVKIISGIGKKYDRFLSAFITSDMRQAASETYKSIAENIGDKFTKHLAPGHATDSKIRDTIDRIINSVNGGILENYINLLTLNKYLDGGKDNGPMVRYVYQILKTAEDSKLARYEKMTSDVNSILEDHFGTKENLAKYKDDRIHFPPFNRYFTREEILSMALNWGNAGNRDRVMKGFSLEEGQVDQILETLDENEWNFVQRVWDYLDNFWPEISALEMRVSGNEPKSVKPVPVKTKFGVFRGGYYPLAYDFERSIEAYKNAEQKNALYKQYSATRAHTDHGHTEARVASLQRPVRLSLNVLFDHLENVVHDLSFREAVIDTSRFMRQPAVKEGVINAVGLSGYRAIDQHIKAIASDQGEFVTPVEKAMRWFRFHTTFATLSYRAYSLPMDLVGNLINSSSEIGIKKTAVAIKDFALNPSEIKNFVDENSERMRYRSQLRDRDISDIAKKWAGKDSALHQFGFMLQSLADEAVSYPVWKIVYDDNLSKHGHDAARNLADEVVARTFGSGSILDQVGAQRGSEFKKVTSMYYSWLSMMFNRAWLSGKLAGLEYDKGNVGLALAGIAKVAFYSWILQGLNENIWREFFRNNQSDDDEEKKKRFLSRFLQQPFSYVWLLRDIAGYGIDRATGRKSNIQLPLQQSIETLIKPIPDALGIMLSEDKEADKNFAESVARSSSILFAYPQTVNNLAFNFIDWLNDEGDLTWRDLISRRTKN